MPATQFREPQRDYILACGGCHGLNGISNSTLVPSLKGLVGYYLYLPEGRAYLPRLPNVAFSTLSDEQLAAVLNYMVFDLGAGSGPRNVTMTSPNVTFCGDDVAILTYVRLTQKLDAGGNPVTGVIEETRVWHREGQRWRHVHFHRSAPG